MKSESRTPAILFVNIARDSETYMVDLSGLKRYINKGYYEYYLPDHHLANKAGFVYEHQIIAEDKLGRDLNTEEVVHHLDMDKMNNSPENLIVFKNNSEHISFHHGCDIELQGDVYVSLTHENLICPLCGKHKTRKAGICLECYRIKHSKHIPSKKELFDLLLKHNMSQIGRMYGVSGNAVKKWCLKYGLPYKLKDIKQLRKVV